MATLIKQRRISMVVASIWAGPWLYYFCVSLALRVAYARDFAWVESNPYNPVPAWYYVPQHVLLFAPILIIGLGPICWLWFKHSPRNGE
jgi:hypothetical protein